MMGQNLNKTPKSEHEINEQNSNWFLLVSNRKPILMLTLLFNYIRKHLFCFYLIACITSIQITWARQMLVQPPTRYIHFFILCIFQEQTTKPLYITL